MIFDIQVPNNLLNERKYILSVILGEFLGLEYQIQVVDYSCDVMIAYGDRHLVICDRFFGQYSECWLQPKSLPIQPLKLWKLDDTNLNAKTVNSDLPVIYGKDPDQADFFEYSASCIKIGLDIFGSAFFMLTRYEEVINLHRDAFDRFPASASLAFQENFLDRPIINEYVEILWSCFQALWPGLNQKQHQFRVAVSHDVDEPFRFAFTGAMRLAQRCAGDILYRRSATALLGSVKTWTQVKALGRYDLDPCNTFDLIMDISEKHGLESAFYFITDHSAGAIDGVYSMDHPLIRQLLRKIHNRGHEIGLHTSYNTYLNPIQTQKEFKILKQVCAEEGIHQEFWGGRQHYLRWRTSMTFQNWDRAGLNYDSTLAYADRIGFRCGTCYEFSSFDLLNRTQLTLKERPLCVMEFSVTRPAYMNLPIDDGSAFSAMATIKKNCRLFGGIFSLLWHNVSFIEKDELSLYEEILHF